MYCKNCGNELKENANYCAFCGNKIDKEEDFIPIETKVEETCEEQEKITFVEETTTKKTKPTKQKKEFDKEELISILFGIMSLIIAPCINIFSIPMSLSGIIFGSYSKSKFKKKFSVGKIISYVSMIIAVISFIFTGILFSTILNDNVVLHTRNNISPITINEKNTNSNNELIPEKHNEKIKIEIPEQSKTQTKKLDSISYKIDESWSFDGMQSVNTNDINSTTHNYHKNDAILTLREMDERLFTTEDLMNYIVDNYGNIITEMHFETNNGNVWSVIKTEDITFNNEDYSTTVYYTHIGNKIIIIEMTNSTLVDYSKEINELANDILPQ